jgi:predicted small integral membrane protein
MANIQAGGQSAVPEAGERPLAVNGDQGLLQALTTEHFTLQTARSATIMETNGRSALFLSTVSSAVVALAFIGQVADDGQPFFLFALAVLPALFVLGLLTYLRLAQSASEDLLYSRAINRIRRYYLELDPAAPSWFLLSGHDDIHGATATWARWPPAGTCCPTPRPWSRSRTSVHGQPHRHNHGYRAGVMRESSGTSITQTGQVWPLEGSAGHTPSHSTRPYCTEPDRTEQNLRPT